jgi:ATP-binding cassette subfamily C (CFTR/MRP) protein 1
MALPMALFSCIINVFMALMAGILIFLGSSYLAAVIPAVIFVLYWLQKFYLRTSRQMRLLDLECQSPLYQYFTETLEGLETIRAFGWQSFCNANAMSRLDDSQRPVFLQLGIQKWLNLVLDLLSASMAICLVALALCVPQSSSPGALGVALTVLLAFNSNLKGLILAWTGTETSLGSVARSESFERFTPTEIAPEEDLDPGADWPVGKVAVSNVSLSYKNGTVALRDVSFNIEVGQKFGICGRTGRLAYSIDAGGVN